MLHLLIKVMLVMRFDMKGTFCNSKRLFNKSAAWSALADWLLNIQSPPSLTVAAGRFLAA